MVRAMATSTSDEIGLGVRRATVASTVAGLRRPRLLPHGAPPVADQRAETGRGRAAQHRLHLVIRAVRRAHRRRPGRFVDPVRRGVPAMPGQVDAAAERHRVVDDDDLLVVRAADRVMVVEAEAHLARHAPAQSPPRQRIALEGVERRVIPDQHVAAELRTPAHDEGEQRVESSRRIGHRRVGAGQQIEVGLDVPADDEDRVARPQQRLARPAEVVGRVLDAAKAIGPIDAPAVVARLHDRRARRSRSRLRSRAALLRRGRHRLPRSPETPVDQPRGRQRNGRGTGWRAAAPRAMDDARLR